MSTVTSVLTLLDPGARTILSDAIATLSSEDQALLYQRYYQGLPGELDDPERAALARLAAALDEEAPGPEGASWSTEGVRAFVTLAGQASRSHELASPTRETPSGSTRSEAPDRPPVHWATARQTGGRANPAAAAAADDVGDLVYTAEVAGTRAVLRVVGDVGVVTVESDRGALGGQWAMVRVVGPEGEAVVEAFVPLVLRGDGVVTGRAEVELATSPAGFDLGLPVARL